MTDEGREAALGEASGGTASNEIPEESRKTNGEERSDDPRADDFYTDGGEQSEGLRASSEIRSDGGVPLNIAGHEEEKRKREQESEDEETTDETDDRTEILGEDLDVDPEATDDDEAEPVELLVQLAEEGEIEPWDIDIVTVTDKFLDRLDGADLRTSGRALFYASVLLRMKSDALLGEDEEEEEPEQDPWDTWDAPMEGGDQREGDFPAYDPVNQLEEEMERRLDRKSARGSPETLDELVRELRERERGSWWKDSRTYDTSESPRGFERGTQTLDYRMDDDMRVDDEPSAGDVTDTAHNEDIETVIEDVGAALDTHYENGRTEVLYAEIASVGGSRIETFLALLFLSHRGTVLLEQDELFDDLWVQDPDAVTEAEEPEPPEAIAD
ncbi:segregation/condensation protein A [Halorussus halophilus]|uniref:segregation/condensation protein A n=1 Tax=Halorussus halophilus TaxID=2650975 RepID=UPI001301486B|nr:ScpA family protein [Halorussus halophilus]